MANEREVIIALAIVGIAITISDFKHMGAMASSIRPHIGFHLPKPDYKSLIISPNIVGGGDAEPGSRPEYGGMVYKLKENSAEQFYCACSLISEYYAVTAAHCCEAVGRIANTTVVRVGNDDWNTVSETQADYRCAEFFVHPNYDPGTYENDIAIIRLEKPVVMSAKVKPIQLPPKGKSIEPGKLCKVSGHGTTSERGDISPKLQTVTVPVISRNECNKNYNKYGYTITDSMICAGVVGKDSCQGDSGGPMVSEEKTSSDNDKIEEYLSGIVSWGIGCARAGFPGVYTDTSYHRDWIRDTCGV